MLFRTYHLHYAIQPDVPVIRQGVTIVIENARAEEALTALLSSVSSATSELIYRLDGSKYVIMLKEGTAPESPAQTTSGIGWDIDVSGLPLEAALTSAFRTMNVNYIYSGSLSGAQPVKIRRHFDSEESALVAILRSAQPEPMRICRKVGNLATLLTTDAGQPVNAAMPPTITCHCSNANFAEVAHFIFRTFRKSLRIDGTLQHSNFNLTLDHASFDETYKAICQALPPNSAHQRDNMYEFGN
jgi:hypothetical protein